MVIYAGLINELIWGGIATPTFIKTNVCMEHCKRNHSAEIEEEVLTEA